MKLKILLVATTIAANAGLFTHDLKYYETHLDDAKEKFEECKKAFMHALIDKDKEKIKELQQDSECIDSEKAIKEARRREEEAKRALEEKKRKEQEAKQKVIFEQKKKEYIEKYKTMDYIDFLKDGKQECSFFSQKKVFGGMDYSQKAFKCVAWKGLQKEKEKKAIEETDAKYPGAKLLEYKNKVCKNAMYGDIKCDFIRNVVFKKREESVIKNYLANKQQLKKDFNECYHKINSLNKKNKYKESQKVQKSYKCYMAKKGALKLNIYGYFQPMK